MAASLLAVAFLGGWGAFNRANEGLRASAARFEAVGLWADLAEQLRIAATANDEGAPMQIASASSPGARGWTSRLASPGGPRASMVVVEWDDPRSPDIRRLEERVETWP